MYICRVDYYDAIKTGFMKSFDDTGKGLWL